MPAAQDWFITQYPANSITNNKKVLCTNVCFNWEVTTKNWTKKIKIKNKVLNGCSDSNANIIWLENSYIFWIKIGVTLKNLISCVLVSSTNIWIETRIHYWIIFTINVHCKNQSWCDAWAYQTGKTAFYTGGRFGVSHQCELLNVSARLENLQRFLYRGSTQMVSL